MDIATYLQCFEDSLTSYTGDDPLDPWEKFVEFLEQRLPAEGDRGMSQVFDSLVQRFLTVERYADDVRYIRYCIKCASYYSDPVVLYSHIFSKGIGTRSAALYVAWAQQFEQRGMNEQADAVYQKAVENQAQPADTLLHEYRQFQTRTRTQLPVSAGSRNPLQNSQLANQMPPSSNKVSVDCPSKPPGNKMTITVSRSETSGSLSSRQDSSVPTVSAYTKEDLVCEGSELCFEEVRAMKYFQKLQEKQKNEQSEIMKRRLREEEESIQRMKTLLEELNQQLEVCGDVSSQTSAHQTSAAQTNSDLLSQPFARPRPSNHRNSRRSLGLRLHTEPPFIHEAAAVPEPPLTSDVSHHSSVLPDSSALKSEATPLPSDPQSVVQTSTVQQNVDFQRASTSLLTPAGFPAVGSGVPSLEASLQLSRLDARQPPEQERSLITESEAKLDASQGGTANLSHITPNSSLGFVQATPSRVLPSPTVNTQEALGVIMDMFQAPTFLEDPFSSASQLHATPTDFNVETNNVAVVTKPTTTAPFTIFQDDDKENFSAAAKSKPVRGLSELAVPKADKPNETSPDLMPDESTVWGSRHNSLAACPNSTSDFAMLAQFVSTPFTHKTFFGGTFFADQETNCDASDADNGASLRCQTKKLSPIMEQSPCDDKDSESTVSQLALSSARQGTIVGEVLASAQHCLTTSSITMVQPPPPVMLSFRDPADSSRSAWPSWEVYTSPERPPKPASPSPVVSNSRPFQILEDLEQRVQSEACDVPMSPECAPGPGWLAIRSPEATAGPDLDAFLSPRHPKKEDTTSNRTLDVPMSPEQPQLSADVPMSPLPPHLHSAVDEPMMSPQRGAKPGANVQLVSDPWDNDLITHLLSTLNPPLLSHPRCITWQCNIPAITPKMTISIGNASLRVDCVLGLGAFATVYQATDPRTSEKMVLKVQKPANPWEFYINTRLDARLQPAVRHLFDRVRSAHLFNNGSVLLSELHNHGTLLNVVNIYKTQSDKVMPQPLVLYFTVCILHMVEQLHAARLIHADVKPDNFMLGERFLDNKCFDSESVDHGLVLIDLGQSIDMELFPEGTAFTARCLTSGFQCTEMLSGRPWNYQTDYFGIAGTVYCMLFGTYMQVTNEGGMWKTNGLFRRNPHADLWLDFFHTLLNVSDCSSPPCLRSLRCKLTSVLQTNYSSKLPMLKSRLVVLLLENHKAGRR
ncbi:mitotic checkpoint serine/threonine-protein kinase BUB1 isoform X3 [Melanotaenia boesemani]|uniref:mitotic checkpoint serine/threonine-protein kinase BUB1 isoform X3 n=1 Tax=Melanotaenia boesemani TaxID=1250792 RepID=UPI001C054F13|nr:mitotic checkpoint serine/threonine-protein kinase BUB1 isoform X3 [Melanotaenia boesemani]